MTRRRRAMQCNATRCDATQSKRPRDAMRCDATQSKRPQCSSTHPPPTTQQNEPRKHNTTQTAAVCAQTLDQDKHTCDVTNATSKERNGTERNERTPCRRSARSVSRMRRYGDNTPHTPHERTNERVTGTDVLSVQSSGDMPCHEMNAASRCPALRCSPRLREARALVFLVVDRRRDAPRRRRRSRRLYRAFVRSFSHSSVFVRIESFTQFAECCSPSSYPGRRPRSRIDG